MARLHSMPGKTPVSSIPATACRAGASALRLCHAEPSAKVVTIDETKRVFAYAGSVDLGAALASDILCVNHTRV